MLRIKRPNMNRPYCVKHYKIVASLAIVLSGAMALMYIFPNTGCTLVLNEWVIVGGWSLLGLILCIWSKFVYKDKFASEVFHG